MISDFGLGDLGLRSVVPEVQAGIAFADGRPPIVVHRNDLLEHTVRAMNLGGGHAGYPVEMKVGEIKDAVFFFTAAAVGRYLGY